jgi:hypothetical protein
MANQPFPQNSGSIDRRNVPPNPIVTENEAFPNGLQLPRLPDPYMPYNTFTSSLAVPYERNEEELDGSESRSANTVMINPDLPHSRPGSHHPAGSHTLEEPKVSRCQKHKKPNIEDDCDSDCFEEYDPFDDDLELRNLLERADRAENRASGRPFRRTKRQAEHPDRLLRDRRKKQDHSRRPYLSSMARSMLRDTPLITNMEHFGKYVLILEIVIKANISKT